MTCIWGWVGVGGKGTPCFGGPESIGEGQPPVHDKCMAVKRITIDMDAYERLSRLKRKGQSFSQVIRELIPAAISTGGDLLEMLDAIDISETTLDALDQIVEDRLPLPPKTLNSGLPQPRPKGRPPA